MSMKFDTLHSSFGYVITGQWYALYMKTYMCMHMHEQLGGESSDFLDYYYHLD
jgi:hypothetical protein